MLRADLLERAIHDLAYITLNSKYMLEEEGGGKDLKKMGLLAVDDLREFARVNGVDVSGVLSHTEIHTRIA